MRTHDTFKIANRLRRFEISGGCLLCLAAILISPAAPVRADELVIGKNQVWSRAVNNRVPKAPHNGSRPRAPLYFWMVYHGNERTIEYLRHKGALPIRHRWSVAVGEDVDIEAADEEFVEKFNRSLSVGSESKEVISALAGQASVNETFSWRTWSKKENVSKGAWRVEVLYDDDTPVQCEVGGQLKPCVFKLRVQ